MECLPRNHNLSKDLFVQGSAAVRKIWGRVRSSRETACERSHAPDFARSELLTSTPHLLASARGESIRDLAEHLQVSGRLAGQQVA